MNKLNLEPCIPPFWALSGHAQTVLGHILPSPMLLDKGQPFELRLADGDQLVGSIIKGTSLIVVYLFHGLGGSTDSTYMHRTARLALQEGHTVIMTNHRGCGEGSGLAQGPYHSGRGEDLSAVIEFGKKLFPKHKHLAIGFSLSGNALLLLLSGKRGRIQPDFAISVNAPIDLQSAALSLKVGLNKIYDIKFFRQCRRDILAAQRAGARDFHVPQFATLYEFDDVYTAPAGGFKNREDYYQSCSTVDLLSEIKIPTVVLTAMDDPFVHREHYLQAKISPQVLLHVEEFGGHMGYLTKKRTPLGTNRWQDYALHQAMKTLLS